MLEHALELKPYINEMLAENFEELQDDFLNSNDWKVLQDIREFLQLFYRVTMETQGDLATLDQTLYTMDFLVNHYKKSEVSNLLFYLL